MAALCAAQEHKPLPGGFCPVSFKDGLKVVGSGFVTVQPKNLQDEAAALQLIKTLAITYMRNGQNGKSRVPESWF